jgi:hypothetical protein
VAMRPAWRQICKPPGEVLNSFAAALNEHWRAASERTVQLFRSTPVSWLEARKVRLPATTSPPVADSSDTHPDPRRC